MSIRRRSPSPTPQPGVGSLYGGSIGLKAGVVPHTPPPPAPKHTRAAFIPEYRTVPLDAGDGPMIVDPIGDEPGREPYFQVRLTYMELGMDKTSERLFTGTENAGTHVLAVKLEDVLSRADRQDIAEKVAGSLKAALNVPGGLFNTSMTMFKNAYQCGAPEESWWYIAIPTAPTADAAALGDFDLREVIPYVFAYTNDEAEPVEEGSEFKLDGATFTYTVTPIGDGSGITLRCIKQIKQ